MGLQLQMASKWKTQFSLARDQKNCPSDPFIQQNTVFWPGPAASTDKCSPFWLSGRFKIHSNYFLTNLSRINSTILLRFGPGVFTTDSYLSLASFKSQDWLPAATQYTCGLPQFCGLWVHTWEAQNMRVQAKCKEKTKSATFAQKKWHSSIQQTSHEHLKDKR